MMQAANLRRPDRWFAATTVWLTVTMAVASVPTVSAMELGSEGNTPIRDPGWPKGAAAVFNNPARVWSWNWEGARDRAEFRGDAKVLNKVLADFAKVETKTKRLVVHDGAGHFPTESTDWQFLVWVPAAWERPTGIAAFETYYREIAQCPPPEIEVYVGGKVRWSDVTVPAGIEVSDERLEAHGFTLADGPVLEGKVVDLATGQPIAARVTLERFEAQPNGGHGYKAVAQTIADAHGHWVLKRVAKAEFQQRVVLASDGYVSRWLGCFHSSLQPSWSFYDRGLSRPGPLSGHVLDEAGKPLTDVEVRLDDIVPGGDGSYLPSDHNYGPYVCKTDTGGLFLFDQIPHGSTTVRVTKTGYCHPGAGSSIATPAEGVTIKLVRTAQVHVTIYFTRTNRPATYLVEIQPESGPGLPTWAQIKDTVECAHSDRFAAGGPWIEIRPIDANAQVCFNEVPPGRYILQGWPSAFGSGGRSTPFTGIERGKPLAIDVKSGERTKVTLPAR
jgi:hypothetical protein